MRTAHTRGSQLLLGDVSARLCSSANHKIGNASRTFGPDAAPGLFVEETNPAGHPLAPRGIVFVAGRSYIYE